MKVIQVIFLSFCILFIGLAASAQELEFAPVAAGEPGKGGFVSWIDTSKLVVPMQVSKIAQPPASFDWRTAGTTPAKDQGLCGVCWIFAGMGDLESKVKLGGDGEWDYSEQEVLDCNPWGAGCLAGGNAWGHFNHCYQSPTVLESAYSYTGVKGSCSAIGAKYMRPLQMRTLADDSPGPARDWIKETIMNEGPLYCSIYSGFTQFQTYWGENYGMYSSPHDTDHAVLLVGWDDSMPYYSTYPGPITGYGCWIIKNSWGIAWGQNGFGYIGYGAAGVATHNSYISQYNTFDYDYGEILRYDPAFYGWFAGVTGDYSIYYAVQYTSTSSEDITGVGIWVPVTDAGYGISIYDDGNPATSTWTGLLATKSGGLTEGGYHMIDLDSPVPIPVDNDFWVGVNITDPHSSNNLLIAMDNIAPIESGKCWVSANGSFWQDASGLGFDVGLHVRLGEPGPLATPTPTDTPTATKTPKTGVDEWKVYR